MYQKIGIHLKFFLRTTVDILLKKQQTCKPGSVIPIGTFYHLSRQPVAWLLQRPTPRQRASNSLKSVYMAFQPMRRTTPDVTTRIGGLLLRLFTLIPLINRTVIFCYATIPHDTFPLGSMVLCVARTFLSSGFPEQR